MKRLIKSKRFVSLIVTIVVMSTMFAIQAFASTYLDYTGPHKNFTGKPIINTSYSDVVSTTYSVDYNFGVLIALKYRYNNHSNMGTPAIKVKRGTVLSSETRYYSDDEIDAETVKFFPSIVNGNATYTVRGLASGSTGAQCNITGQARYF